MESVCSSFSALPSKVLTGSGQADQEADGYLLHGSMVLLADGSDSVITILLLYFLAGSAQECRTPTIFVALGKLPGSIAAKMAGLDESITIIYFEYLSGRHGIDISGLLRTSKHKLQDNAFITPTRINLAAPVPSWIVTNLSQPLIALPAQKIEVAQ